MPGLNDLFTPVLELSFFIATTTRASTFTTTTTLLSCKNGSHRLHKILIFGPFKYRPP